MSASAAAQPVIVLAAGHGTRMGGPKAFAQAGNATFLERILARIGEAGCPAIVTADPAFRERVEAVLKTWPGAAPRLVPVDGTQPMLVSVQAGIGALDRDLPGAPAGAVAQGAWLWPVDAPLLSAEGWRRARERAAAHPEAILKLRAQGRTGHPTWFPRWACKAIAAGRWDTGLLGFLAEVPAARIAVLELPDETLTDFNTPEQLAAARL